MVEFALVMPVLFLVLFGIIQFGALYNDYITLTDAARIGARKAAVSRQTGNPGRSGDHRDHEKRGHRPRPRRS